MRVLDPARLDRTRKLRDCTSRQYRRSAAFLCGGCRLTTLFVAREWRLSGPRSRYRARSNARIIREVSPSVLTDWFRSRVTPQKWPLSDKDELALAVAAEANAQRSPKLEFLGLVNALEVLIEEKVRTQAQEQFIGRWKCEIDEATIKAQEKNETGLADELAEIRKRLDFNSIQGGLRRIFEGVAAAEGWCTAPCSIDSNKAAESFNRIGPKADSEQDERAAERRAESG